MVPLASLWLPILLSAIAVFVLSALAHMLLKYHQSDFAGLSNETEVMDAVRRSNATSGEYMFPHSAGGMESMKDPVWLEKFKRGPVGMLTIVPTRGDPGLGRSLSLWFVYNLVVSLIAGYLASRVFGPGEEARQVFRLTSTVAFAGYVLALWQSTIWYSRPVSTNIKNTIDGLLYSLATGAVFCWLWPM
jgi:hypothetical protein